MKKPKRLNPGAIAIIACTCILVLIFVIAYFRGLKQVDEEYERIKNEYYSNAQSNLQNALESMNAATDEPESTTSSVPVTTPEPIQAAHNEGEWIIDIEAACSTPGSKHTVCADCGETVRTQAIPATGHTWVKATCTEVKHCSVCNIEEGSALGHTTDNGICTRCGNISLKSMNPIVYTGSGDKVITDVNIPEGIHKVTMSHTGESNFMVHPYNSDGSRESSFANQIGNYKGSIVINKSLTNGYIEVKADGKWEIRIEAITETGTSNLEGTGDRVSPLFKLKQGVLIVKLNHIGDSYFDVLIYDNTGKQYWIPVSEIGTYSGEVVFNEGDKNKLYCIQVIATNTSGDEGTWSVDFGIDSEVTRCDD